jgi:hypothetical protein
MIDSEKRKFNVNDILGDFDRDERGHPLILQDKKGELIDKGGHRVNEKGYLVDSKTGDILEKEKGRERERETEKVRERGTMNMMSKMLKDAQEIANILNGIVTSVEKENERISCARIGTNQYAHAHMPMCTRMHICTHMIYASMFATVPTSMSM